MSASALRERLAKGEPKERIGLALDNMSWSQAAKIMQLVGPYIGFVKVNSLSRSKGIKYAWQIAQGYGFELMADAKTHDTLRTVKDDVASMTEDGAQLITMHASAAVKTLEAGLEGRNQKRDELRARLGSKFNPFIGTLLGITVLTDHDDESCIDTYGAPVLPTALKFARRAYQVGLDGIVCGTPELETFQADEELRGLLKVVPGIVLPGTAAHRGQQRIGTPYDAIVAGADIIILGTAVTKAASPEEAAQIVLEGVTEGLAA